MISKLAKDLCLHVAAVNPICISREDVPEELVEKEREIAASRRRPPAAVQKIIEGKLNKYYAYCLHVGSAFCQRWRENGGGSPQ